ncbi:MAG: NDP-sugar synthase, partial [Candidatus Odinarchaeota archaeon]
LIEKPKNIECKEAYIATGIYIFKKDALESVDEKQFIDHTGEIFPIILTAGKKVSGFKTSFYWSDIGDFKNYLETNRWVLEHKRGKIKPSSNNIDGLSYTASPSIADNSCVESSIILKGAVVKGKCRIINSMIYENTIIGEEASIINSIIAENTVVEEQVSVENSIIGANTLIKANSNIKDAKIWPRMIIETGGIVKGTIQHDYLPLK